ncbi:unnamed protein product [Caenorhabditis angaria]|uniref:Uncharacterized protein n=1 Tax=Caenorhabditis angaria TaxID=860376 RepID=A0A9P1IRH2_9PELO|nr:unnamed protein product [Caenorhabditis angaria]
MKQRLFNSVRKKNVLCNSILMPMLSAYPVIDPIVITFALTDYREAVFKIFGRNTKRISNNLATVLETIPRPG